MALHIFASKGEVSIRAVIKMNILLMRLDVVYKHLDTSAKPLAHVRLGKWYTVQSITSHEMRVLRATKRKYIYFFGNSNNGVCTLAKFHGHKHCHCQVNNNTVYIHINTIDVVVIEMTVVYYTIIYGQRH